ncbi:hypothetical protein BDR26DRAFT_937146 [Obelidium mucronatum]|nr:hypothetical protein BDR26DRAFT_937146 [Obelidium mucronatum]
MVYSTSFCLCTSSCGYDVSYSYTWCRVSSTCYGSRYSYTIFSYWDTCTVPTTGTMGQTTAYITLPTQVRAQAAQSGLQVTVFAQAIVAIFSYWDTCAVSTTGTIDQTVTQAVSVARSSSGCLCTSGCGYDYSINNNMWCRVGSACSGGQYSYIISDYWDICGSGAWWTGSSWSQVATQSDIVSFSMPTSTAAVNHGETAVDVQKSDATHAFAGNLGLVVVSLYLLF